MYEKVILVQTKYLTCPRITSIILHLLKIILHHSGTTLSKFVVFKGFIILRQNIFNKVI